MKRAHYQVLSPNPVKRWLQNLIWAVQSELQAWRGCGCGGAMVTAAGVYVV